MKTNNQNLDTGFVQGWPLALLRLEGALVFILSIVLYERTSASWWLFVALLLVPDLVMFAYLWSARWGAVFYNAAHSYAGPVLLIAFATARSRPEWLPYPFIWVAHIAIDRSLGYGLKYAVGFKQTHLGLLGSRKSA
jgi:hypothetical protein